MGSEQVAIRRFYYSLFAAFWEREWLYWYDDAGHQLITPEEMVKKSTPQAEQAVAQSEEKTAKLAAKLQELEINSDEV
ncbi:MAG: hypothetical protein AAGE59_38190 [Cyanobacteria bacterium P01_F01_bin.86]